MQNGGGRWLVWLMMLLLLAGCTGMNKRVTERDRLAAGNYYQLAVTYFSQGQIIESIKALRDGEAYNPRDPQIHNLYGLIYLYKGMYKDSEASYLTALKIDPAYSDASLNLAATYMAQAKWNEALRYLKLPAEDLLYHDKDKVYDNMGWCYFQLGDRQKAKENLKAATIENEKNCHAWYNLGMVQTESKELDEAEASFEKVTAYCATERFGYLQLGKLTMQRGDKAKARLALEKCISLGGASAEGIQCRDLLKSLSATP